MRGEWSTPARAMLGDRSLSQRIKSARKSVFLDLFVPLVVETVSHPLVKPKKIFTG